MRHFALDLHLHREKLVLGRRCPPEKLVIADFLPPLREVFQSLESLVRPGQVPEPVRLLAAVLFAALDHHVPAQFPERAPLAIVIVALQHGGVLGASLIDQLAQLEDES